VNLVIFTNPNFRASVDLPEVRAPLFQVLLRLRPAPDDGGDAKGRKANTEAAYLLLEALYGLMDPAAYLSGISGLLHHEVSRASLAGI
jgi:hypothetical protein